MPIITLTTDWRKKDYYVAAIKGTILQECPGANIIDISHEVQLFNITEAAFILRNSYSHFPEGTVHLVCVNSEPNHEKPHVIVKYDNYYFIGTDNGIFGLALYNNPVKIVEIKTEHVPSSFPTLKVLAPVAAKIANGQGIDSFGSPREMLNRQIPIRAIIEDSVIIGTIIYIDSFSNVITNISKDLFEKVGKGRKFEIYLGKDKITRLNNTYQETSEGEILALFNELDLLEVAMCKGEIAKILSITTKSNIRVKFFESGQKLF